MGIHIESGTNGTKEFFPSHLAPIGHLLQTLFNVQENPPGPLHPSKGFTLYVPVLQGTQVCSEMELFTNKYPEGQ